MTETGAPDYYRADYARIRVRPQSGGPAPEITARVAYGRLPWRERLVTRPPSGWQGAWMARLLSRLTR